MTQFVEKVKQFLVDLKTSCDEKWAAFCQKLAEDGWRLFFQLMEREGYGYESIHLGWFKTFCHKWKLNWNNEWDKIKCYAQGKETPSETSKEWYRTHLLPTYLEFLEHGEHKFPNDMKQKIADFLRHIETGNYSTPNKREVSSQNETGNSGESATVSGIVDSTYAQESGNQSSEQDGETEESKRAAQSLPHAERPPPLPLDNQERTNIPGDDTQNTSNEELLLIDELLHIKPGKHGSLGNENMFMPSTPDPTYDTGNSYVPPVGPQKNNIDAMTIVVASSAVIFVTLVLVIVWVCYFHMLRAHFFIFLKKKYINR